MFKKQVVLVAGFDYEFSGADFAATAQRRLKKLVKENPKDQLKFTLFDVGAGTVRINELDSKGKKRSWTDAMILDFSTWLPTLKKFNTVSDANYDEKTEGRENNFTKNQKGVMSILDVYDYVQLIGAGTGAGTLTELSFFSHGWMGGAILVNSSELPVFRSPGTTTRDPDDKDSRPNKDFVPPTMDAAKLSNFSKAFDPRGIVWIWGCDFAKAYLRILAGFFRKKPKDKALKKLKDSDLFKLEFEEDLSNPDPHARFLEGRIFDDVMRILPGGVLKSATAHNPARSYAVTKSLADLRTAFKNDLKKTYSSVIAHAAGVNGIGALMGTYGDYEIKGYQLMLIPRTKPPYKDDFTRFIDFYKTIVGVTTDPENRGYGVFPP